MTPYDAETTETVDLECEVAWAQALIQDLYRALEESAAAHHEAEIELARLRAVT